MPNVVKRKGNEKKVFFRIYEILRETEPSLEMKDYCFGVLPFLYDDTKAENTNYIYCKRILIDAWEKDGRLGAHGALRKKLREKTEALRPESLRFRKLYQNNPVTSILETNDTTGVADRVLAEALLCVGEGLLPDVPSEELENRILWKDYGRFLFLLVQSIFTPQENKANAQPSARDALLCVMEENNVKPEQLYAYTEQTLLKQNKSGTYGMLEILRRAGAPHRIRKECDPFTLLEASDIFYYHRFGGRENEEERIRDIANAYRYSKAAFSHYGTPVAAWNMGYSWYQHGAKAGSVFADIEGKDAFDGEEETCLLHATEYFLKATEYEFADAYASLGNICRQLQGYAKEYGKLTAKLFRELHSRFYYYEKTRDENFADEGEKLAAYGRFCYRRAAELGSIPGMQNFYNLLMKEMMTQSGKETFQEYLSLHAERIHQIRRCLEELCAYGVPTALTDAATLSLHRHSLNAFLASSRITHNGNPLTGDVPYDLILPYYAKKKNGRAEAVGLLERAAEMNIPDLKSPWPAYYLAELALEELDYERALYWSERAAGSESYVAVRITTAQKKRFEELYLECKAKAKRRPQKK